MAFNLLEAVSGLFTGSMVNKAASSLGESETAVQKAMNGVVPAVLTGILNKAGSGNGPLNSVFNMAKDASDSGILNNLAGLLGAGGSGLSNLANMAGGIFGDKLGNVASLISNYAGIKTSSASSLLNVTAPAALGVIGRYASNNSLSPAGLLAMLASQKDKILSVIPSGLGLAGALGLGSVGDIGSKLTSTLSTAGSEAKKSVRWLPLLLLGVLGVALLWYLLRDKKPAVADTAVTQISDPVVTPTPAVTSLSIKVKLPDGVELDAYKGGIEDRLVTFLNDPSSVAGKDTWFDFDNLNFEMASARITTESQPQVNNIAAILKAYPKVKIKIGGYTDKTGDAAANKKLSQDRADAVVVALKSAGANATQLVGAEGYGSEFAKVPAEASDEERKPDRRIAVSVREK